MPQISAKSLLAKFAFSRRSNLPQVLYKIVSPCWLLTVPLKCKLPPSRETRLVSLETILVSLKCTVSTNALPSGECTNGIIEIHVWFCAHLQCIHEGVAFVWNERLAITIDCTLVLIYFTIIFYLQLQATQVYKVEVFQIVLIWYFTGRKRLNRWLLACGFK